MSKILLRKNIVLICSFSVLLSNLLICEGIGANMDIDKSKSVTKVLILGASVGQSWRIDSLAERIKDSSLQYEFIAKFDPDKTDILDQALNRKDNKPDLIILKQCAAYFRSDQEVYDSELVDHYKNLAESWVEKSLNNGVIPILATVVPISEKMPVMVKMKRIVKKYILQKDISPYYRKTRLEGILDYNDWVREYAKQNNLEVLDLEYYVRISDTNRWLNHDFTTDGLHLNKKAYQRLDPILISTVKKAVDNQ